MPYDDPDATDPMALRGVAVETQDDRAMREMAECFVEEYLRNGFDANRIAELFCTRVYTGPFLAQQALGENAIRRIIDERLALRNQYRDPERSGQEAYVRITLPVLRS